MKYLLLTLLFLPTFAFAQKNARKEDPRPKVTRNDSLYVCVLTTKSTKHLQNGSAHIDRNCKGLTNCRGEIARISFKEFRRKSRARTCEICCRQTND